MLAALCEPQTERRYKIHQNLVIMKLHKDRYRKHYVCTGDAQSRQKQHLRSYYVLF